MSKDDNKSLSPQSAAVNSYQSMLNTLTEEAAANLARLKNLLNRTTIKIAKNLKTGNTLQITLDNKSYELVKVLGGTDNCLVVLAIDGSGHPFAMKLKDNVEGYIHSSKEAKILQRLDRLFGFAPAYSTKDIVGLPLEPNTISNSLHMVITDFIPGVDLFDEFQAKRDAPEPYHWRTRRKSKVLAFILSAVNQLANLPADIIHGDMKLENCMYRCHLSNILPQHRGKLIDLDHGEILNPAQKSILLTGPKGTRRYQPPETIDANTLQENTLWQNLIKAYPALKKQAPEDTASSPTTNEQKRLYKSSDIFSLGMSILERIFQENCNDLPEWLLNMLHEDHEKRISATKLQEKLYDELALAYIEEGDFSKALCLASHVGIENIIELIEPTPVRKNNFNAKRIDYYCEAILQASYHGDLATIKTLFSKIEQQHLKPMLLYAAIQYDHPDVVAFYLKIFPKWAYAVQAKTQVSLLHYAAHYNSSKCYKFLLQHYANNNKKYFVVHRDKSNKTAADKLQDGLSFELRQYCKSLPKPENKSMLQRLQGHAVRTPPVCQIVPKAVKRLSLLSNGSNGLSRATSFHASPPTGGVKPKDKQVPREKAQSVPPIRLLQSA